MYSMFDKPIFFDWERLAKQCDYKVSKIYKTFVTGKYRDFPGCSFILNPKPLFDLPDIYQSEIVEYIRVASIRNYFYAQYLRYVRLPTVFASGIEINTNNRLLKIVGEEILFRYEEEYGFEVR